VLIDAKLDVGLVQAQDWTFERSRLGLCLTLRRDGWDVGLVLGADKRGLAAT
jgi:hypothetical protein